ncbi:bifunctional riboflavin kinase/FAD synthetase [Marisediminicola senii]|uniref:bifunctional riboflavin kinase/FAD synthetase n=1 Tax=Marisediminicola senii TaxID=2711233 RepID=UPI0013EB936E|nr:bifunctional riboflavin kinase/FAD synthetase [Marisediminicola senii]
MQFYDSLDAIPADLGPTAVTFGKFDGIHLGHQHVIAELLAVARERDLTPTVVTFDRNPLALLDPARAPENLTSPTQKRQLIEAAGIDAMVELPFDRALSTRSAEDFIDNVLVGALHASVVLVGPDTRFGRGGLGHFDTLVDHSAAGGYEVRRLEFFSPDDDVRVSSTRIRALMATGNVSEAARLLGRRPVVRSMVVHGQKRGRALGYPTANLDPAIEGFVPADGVYAGYLILDGRRLPSAVSIGNNPTFDGVPQRQVEAYVIDDDLDLYDRVVEIEFVEFIRGMVKFDGIDPLIVQMKSDTDQAREILRVDQLSRAALQRD